MTEKNQEAGTRKKLNVWLPMLFAMTAVGSIMLGFQLKKSTDVPAEEPSISLTNRTEVGKIEEMLRYIEAKYVDDVDREKLMETAISSMLEELDPHSTYIPEDQLKSVNESLEGSFDGIGISFFLLQDTILVVSSIEDGPSEKVGIQKGDKIISINDSIVAGIGITNADIIELLRGKRGSEVKLGILRKEENDLLSFNVTRDKIPDLSIESAYMIDDNSAYVRISRFSNTTYEEFMKSIEELHDAGMKNLIIDVRQNNGGYLSAVTKMVDQLFETGRKLIVYTEGRTQRRNDYKSSGRNFFDINEIVVLVDEGSASASEILAGAIQDWDRGTIIGRRTFGKGLVQEQYKLSDGSALRLTVARYYTPSGRSIQKSYDGLSSEYQNGESRLESGELHSRDSIKIADSTEYKTASGRTVYGGGGIIPDIFVPIDSSIHNSFFIKSIQHVPEFVYQYIDDTAKNSSYETFKEFNQKFSVDDALFEEFLTFVDSKKIVRDSEQINNCKDLLKLRMKSFFARHYFQSEGFYQVMNQKDPVFLRALQELYN